jgi:hypothetical protein
MTEVRKATHIMGIRDHKGPKSYQEALILASLTTHRPLVLKVVIIDNMVQSMPLILACGGFNNRLVSACGLTKLTTARGRAAVYCSKFPEPDLCPILTPAEIRHFRNQFPKSFQEISHNATHKVSTLPQWESNMTQPATTPLVAAVSSTTIHTQSPTNPPWSVKRVCTHLLMRKQCHPAPPRLGSRGPLGSHVWQLLVKLIPPHVSRYYPWAPEQDILRWQNRGNTVYTRPSPGQDTADVGDVVLYCPPPGEFSTTLSTVSKWDKPYTLVSRKDTRCCIA